MTSSHSTKNDGYRYQSVIQPADAGRTVLAFLSMRYPHSRADIWRARIVDGQVLLNELETEDLAVIKAGDRVTWDRPGWVEPNTPQVFKIIHEDMDLVVVSKPSGLPTLPGGGFLRNTLLAMVQHTVHPEARPLHRLGRATSGLVLFTKNSAATSVLSRRWPNVRKTYRALASGVALDNQFEVDHPIGPVRHPRLGTVFAANPAGKPAKSVATVLERRGDSTLFEVDLQTGRAHQIRIHLASIGYPLVGDPLYDVGGLPKANDPGLPGDPGYNLHAWRLFFEHPITGRPIETIAEPPEILLFAGDHPLENF